MYSNIEEVLKFHCPRWKELPDSLLSKDVCAYIDEILYPIVSEHPVITGTMIQNYVKWKIVQRPDGRKYNRFQIAQLIVVSIYKEVIELSKISKGTDLLLNIADESMAYDFFASALDSALMNVFSGVSAERLIYGGYDVAKELAGVTLIANAFALKLLGRKVIDSEGYKNLGV